MKRRLWIINAVMAFGCATIGGMNLMTGHPMLAPLMFVSAIVNGGVGGFNRAHYARPPEPAHRPDYAKIRRLELELGLGDPDPVSDPEPMVRVTRVDQIRHADPQPYCPVCRGRGPRHLLGCPFDDPGPGAPEMPKPPDPRKGQHYERVVPPAVTSPNEWAYCPVCTRRHAGRCAG